MADVEERVRRAIERRMAARGITKTALGEAAGRNQSWASRYLDGEFSASLETLERVAAFFGEPISALFDEDPDPEVDELLKRFRATTTGRRRLLLELLREWVPNQAVKLERGGRRRIPARSEK